jgi:alpha-L-fucosidase
MAYWMNRRQMLIASTAVACEHLLHAMPPTAPPAKYGATPSPRQRRWQQLETYAFLHFTVNTFTDKEWGYGDEDPNVFHPTAFDADAIVRPLKAAGMKAVILTCKHHDGFCLWPTKTTEHCVRNSGWRNGKGDVVAEISAAARRAGLGFGVYVSPWDRANPLYGTPAYLPVYREQIKELLTNYGLIFEVWFDGANGGDGYYGGARETRTIDKDHYYEWPATLKMVRSLQPEAAIFCPGGDVKVVGPGGDIRWIGNENGIAGDPCWATYNPPSSTDQNEHASASGSENELMTGVRNGLQWMPAECDVSIRPGWFWHEKENAQVKTPEQLVDLYFESVGRGASLLLNVPPNRLGLLQDTDIQSLTGFRKRLDRLFAVDLAQGAKLKASNVRGAASRFDAYKLADRNPSTYWATDDSVRSAEVVLDLGKPQTISVVRLREAISLGQRIRAFGVDLWQDGIWTEVATGTSIGACKLIRLQPQSVTTRLRLRITASDAAIALSELSLFAQSAA